VAVVAALGEQLDAEVAEVVEVRLLRPVRSSFQVQHGILRFPPRRIPRPRSLPLFPGATPFLRRP
jgi:hypothetical protein